MWIYSDDRIKYFLMLCKFISKRKFTLLMLCKKKAKNSFENFWLHASNSFILWCGISKKSPKPNVFSFSVCNFLLIFPCLEHLENCLFRIDFKYSQHIKASLIHSYLFQMFVSSWIQLFSLSEVNTQHNPFKKPMSLNLETIINVMLIK